MSNQHHISCRAPSRNGSIRSLRTGGIGNDPDYSGNPLGYPQLVHIKNTQTLVANSARNVTARIEYAHADGTTFIVPEAAWLRTTKLGDGSVARGITPNVSIEGNDSQPFVLMQIDDSGNHWASRNMSQAVGLLDIGKWTVSIYVSSLDCKPLTGTIGFTVLRDSPRNRLAYDRPAFHAASED
jgi:hypothetical protein